MVNLDQVLSDIISILNNSMQNYLFIRNYNINNKPPYPYCTIGVLTPYIPQNENNIPNISMNFDGAKDKITYTRKEDVEVVLSFNSFCDTEEKAYQVCQNTIACLKFLCSDELDYKGIVYVNNTNPNNITGILETDFEYRFQFDVTIRIDSVLNKDVDYTKIINLHDEERNKDIIIKE